MMNKIIFNLFLIFLLMPFRISAQNKMGFDSSIIVSKEGQIFSSRKIVIDNNNNKYIVGFFKGTISNDTFSISTKTEITNNVFDLARGVFIAKYNNKNRLIWLKKFAESDSLYDINIVVDNSNCILISYAFLNKCYLLQDSISINFGTNINLLKYDENGHIVFSKLFLGNGNEGIGYNGITFDNLNNIYLACNFGVSGVLNYQFIIGIDTFVSINGDFLLINLDSNGNLIKVKKYGGFGTDGIGYISYQNNFLYLIGVTNVYNTNLDSLQINFPASYLHGRYYIAKFDLDLKIKWVKKFGNNDIQSSGIRISSLSVCNNRIYFTGNSNTNNTNTFLFEGGPTLTGNGNSEDYFIACYDTAGNFVWNTISDTYGSNYMAQLATDTLGNVYGVGGIDYTTRFPTDTLYSQGSNDVMVCSYDSMGHYRWAISGGGSSTDMASGIALDTHGKPYIVGGTTSSAGCLLGNDTLYPPANQSTLFFASIDSINNSNPLAIANIQKSNATIYPNPADNKLIIENLPPNSLLSISNTMGQAIKSQTFTQPKTEINTSALPNGIYFLRLQSNNAMQTLKINIEH